MNEERMNHTEDKKSFTKEELSKYNGKNGKPSYVAVNGVVYDVSSVVAWQNDTHFGMIPGNELTSDFNACHPGSERLTTLPMVGKLI